MFRSEQIKIQKSETDLQKLKTILRNYPWDEEAAGDKNCGCAERPKLLGL